MAAINRKPNGRRVGLPRRREAAGAEDPRGHVAAPGPIGSITSHGRWEPSSVELFGRRPFTAGTEPRFYGTGVAGYQSGPGFTGGYYGFGDIPPDIPTELEREYAYDLYGEDPGPGWTADPPVRYAADAARAAPLARTKRVRKYPPGPKGYQRSDERMREQICDQLMHRGYLDSSDVTVEVSSARVVLDGTVPERWMKHAMENLADACPGIQDVENRIRVRKAPEDSPSEAV